LVHSCELLDEMNAFLERCTRGDAPLPTVVVLSGEKGAGRRFLLAELAHKQGCLLLTVNGAEAAAENAPLIAGLALLYDAMLALTDYTASAVGLLEELFDFFSVLLVTTENPMENFGARCRGIFARTVEPLTPAQRADAIHMLFPRCSQAEQTRAADTYRMSPGRLTKAAARMRAEASVPSLM
ncbi:MAG: hypothetical protein RRY53_07960, partial [Pseudoflavonifractor sp.]